MENLLEKYKVELSTKDEMVSCIILDEKGRPLRLQRKENEKVKSPKYDFCSGSIKKGEIPLIAMMRELIENLQLDQKDICEIYRLGEVETLYPQVTQARTHMYCLFTNCSIETINQKLKENPISKLSNGEFLKDLQELKEQLKNLDIGWRVPFNCETREKIDEIGHIIEKRLQQRER